MKHKTPLIALLALLSAGSGYLMSEATWLGRVGITFFHKGYNLVKIWWQGAIAVFLILMILMRIHEMVQKKLPRATATIIHGCLLLLALTGLYFTYDDFHTDLSHRLLGHHFHYGFYLGWVGWIMICLFYIFDSKQSSVITGQDRKVTADQ